MDKKTVLFQTTIALAAMLLLCTRTNADLCVLKTDNYSLSSKYSLNSPSAFTSDGNPETETPCADADSENGDTDDIIDLEFVIGSDIEVDIVYEQDPSEQFRVEHFNYIMFFDSVNMSIGDSSSGDCNPDPAGFFKDNACTFVNTPCCNTYRGGDDIPSVMNLKINFFEDKWPADPANFVLDQLVFANTFSVGNNLYNFTFEETGALRTDVAVLMAGTENCVIFSGSGVCDKYNVTLQDIMTSRISMVGPSTWVGAPSTASVTCTPDPVSCAADPLTASATVTLSYSVSTQHCYETAACAPASTTGSCTGIVSAFGVEFTDLAGTVHTQQNSGTFTESTTIGTTPSYTLKGVHMANGLASCSSTKVVTAPAPCACGEAPIVTLTTDITKTFYEGSDMSISYLITDPDTDMSEMSQIKFYYTNDITHVAQMYEVDIASELGSDGKLWVKIPKSFLDDDVPIYFGIIVIDDMGISGAYPEDFSVNADGTLSYLTSSYTSSICKCGGTYQEPYPNQFPFIPGENGDNPLVISFMLELPSVVTMSIYSMDGRLVRVIQDSDEYVSNNCSGEDCNRCNWASGCVWDGRDMRGTGNIVSSGMYIINIHAETTEGETTGQPYDYTKGIVVMR